jgi:pilus assembly protein FimV
LLGDPIILAAIGGVVLLLLILVVLKRRKGGSDDESGITVSGDDDLFAGEDDEELTPIHLADGVEPAAETDINLPVEEDSIVEEPTIEKPAAAPDEDLSATAGISPTEMPEPEAPAPAAASSEQDDVLNEVDVYLAYGLYDNAEELLNSNLAENPERADYRSKLLDTYFATKNTDSFVKEAEKLKSMGDVATGYWDRVQIMGYELAPDNPLFSDAKDSDMSAADLEITKPQEADFDLIPAEISAIPPIWVKRVRSPPPSRYRNSTHYPNFRTKTIPICARKRRRPTARPASSFPTISVMNSNSRWTIARRAAATRPA